MQKVIDPFIAADLLDEFQFDWHLKGTQYLCEILEGIQKEGKAFLDRSPTKEILPEVARKHRTTWTAVERAIRYSIDSAWLRALPDKIFKYFPRDYPQTGRPSVMQFVYTVGRVLLRKCAEK